MGKIIDKVSLSKEWYQEAKEKGLSFSDILERQAKKEGKFAEDVKLGALSQQLAARDLQLAGTQASFVEDFFRTEESRILFPEVINEFVNVGMREQLKSFVSLDDLIATRTGIAGSVYQSAALDLPNSTDNAARVGEKGEFPAVMIQFKENVVKLFKVGYRIEATYEAVRRMRMNVFGVTMKVLGRNMTRTKAEIAIEVLINGDGNSNPITGINSATSGTLVYGDVVNLEESFEEFQPTLLIAPKAMRVAYRNLTEYKDANGPDMMEPPKRSEAVPTGKIIALDASASLEEVYEKGESLVEYDKIISKQFEQAVVSEVSGFAKLFPDAAKMLHVVHP